MTTPANEVDVVVVGAGFSGLYTVHLLRKQGLTLQGFEAGADVGGTWFDDFFNRSENDFRTISSLNAEHFIQVFAVVGIGFADDRSNDLNTFFLRQHLGHARAHCSEAPDNYFDIVFHTFSSKVYLV